jgi:hypothetical protein
MLGADGGLNQFRSAAMQHIHGFGAKQALKVAKMVAVAIGILALLLLLSGCASIPQRAWDNGAAVSRSDAHRAMMRGERGFHTARSLYGSMDPYQSLYQTRPYEPFGRW